MLDKPAQTGDNDIMKNTKETKTKTAVQGRPIVCDAPALEWADIGEPFDSLVEAKREKRKLEAKLGKTYFFRTYSWNEGLPVNRQ